MSERGIAGVWSSKIWIGTETWWAGGPRWGGGGPCERVEARRWVTMRNAAAAAAG